MFLCFFFFSSRRRHTRLQGDWSSDVCSSDLARRAPRKETLALGIDRHLELELTRARRERDAIRADVRRAVEPHVLAECRERPRNGLESVDLARWADASRREQSQVTDVRSAVDDSVAGPQEIRVHPGDVALVSALGSHRSL